MTQLDWLNVLTGLGLGALILLNIFRIVLSWYPQIELKQSPYTLIYYPTEPLLSLLRRAVPPLGGVDMSPVMAVALFSLIREILLGQQGILTMLAR